MLLGLIRSDAGEVRLFGEALTSRRQSLMRRVGAFVESPSLYPHLTGRENLEVTRRLLGSPRHLIDLALDNIKLTKDANRRVREYSLGMRQRLGLALALLNKPELLILDEPTNGLDPAGIHEMRDLIRRLPEEFGVTVFLSSHSAQRSRTDRKSHRNHSRRPSLVSGTTGRTASETTNATECRREATRAGDGLFSERGLDRATRR